MKAVIWGSCPSCGSTRPLGAGNTHHSRQWAAVIVGAPPCRTRGRLPAALPADRLLLPSAVDLGRLLFQPGCFLRGAPRRPSTSDVFIMSVALFCRSRASGFRAENGTRLSRYRAMDAPARQSWLGRLPVGKHTTLGPGETWWWSGNAELTFWELCSPGLRLMVYWLPSMPLGLQVVLRCQQALITWCCESWRSSGQTHSLL